MFVFVWVSAISGPLFLIGAAFAYSHARAFVTRAVRAEGTVVELVDRGGSSGTTYAPVFLFTDAADAKHKVYSSLSSYPPAYEVGEKVTILYDPDKPQKAKIEGFFSLWLVPFILAAIGGLDCLFAAVFIAVGKWLSRRTEEQTAPS
jgi:hypothetical protein